MKSLFFKSLALSIIVGCVTVTAVSAYDVNHHRLTVISQKKPVGFVNDNPIFVRSQHDSQGADNVTLADVTAQSFTLNYQISEATLAYFYPAIGNLVQPAESLYRLLTTGTDWVQTNHYWQPLKINNPFNSFLGTQLYASYVKALLPQIQKDFFLNNNLIPSYDLAVLQEAFKTGASLDLQVQAATTNNTVTNINLIPSVVPSNYPSSAKTYGVDAVWGNMDEPNNLLKINLSAKSCQIIHNQYSQYSDFIKWLFAIQGFSASGQLNQVINARAMGLKYDANTGQIINYWNTANLSLVQKIMQELYQQIITAVNKNLATNGITLVLSRNLEGEVSMIVNSQLPAYRTVYYQDSKVLHYPADRYVYLNVTDLMALRLASFRYLTDDAQYTPKAFNNFLNWLFDSTPTWDNANVVHSYAFGKKLTFLDGWKIALAKINWRIFDQSSAQYIIQNRGAVLALTNFVNPSQGIISFYPQNAIPE